MVAKSIAKIYTNIHKPTDYQVGFLQTAHYWANAGVLLGGRVRRGNLSKQLGNQCIKSCLSLRDTQGCSGYW